MRPRNSKTILYFILGAMPTEAQYKEAEKLGAVFRNANQVGDSDNLEHCDQVIGAVPKRYETLRMGVDKTRVEFLKSAIEEDPDEPTTGGAGDSKKKPWENNETTVSFADAVELLDAENDDHWTADSRPDCNALAAVGCVMSAEARDHEWAVLQDAS